MVAGNVGLDRVPLTSLQLSDLLKEKRQEVERNHARQLEKMQEAHRETIAEIQAQNEDEVSLQPNHLVGKVSAACG